MLHLWFCVDRKQNTKSAFQLIRQNYLSGVEEQILLVPEQFSHSVQEAFCRSEGDRASLMAQVLDFTRLAGEVFSREGGIAELRAGAPGKLLMMALAVEQVRSRLKIYGNSAEKPEFLMQLLYMLDEFRSYCVTSDSLRKASADLEGILGQKMEEFSLLMESFDAVCHTCGMNPKGLLNQLAETMEISEYPKGKRFYLDGFSDFTGVQLEILTEILMKADEVHMYLTCDDPLGTEQQFDTARHTAKHLLSLCNHWGVPFELHQTKAEGNDALFYLRRNLFFGKLVPYSDGNSDHSVSFLSAPDSLRQSRIAAGQILRLTSEGVRLRDIHIACADYDKERPILETVLRRAEIPAYFAGSTNILKQPLVQMLLSALDAATGGMEQEHVLSYIKSAFSPLDRERSDCLENYIRLWDISGRGFREEWTMHPHGLNEKQDEASDAELSQLLEDRRIAIEPLLRLSRNFRAAGNTGQMTKAFYGFMEEIGIRERLEKLAQECFDRGELRRSQEYVQLYDIIKELLEQIYGVLGSTVRSNEDYLGIFRTALSRCSVGTIPAGLDCVIVGSISSMRRSNCRYLFLLSANEGCFPRTTERNSLLTDQERRELLEQGIGVSPSATGRLERELCAIDSVLNAPDCGIFFGAADGKESYYYRRARDMFPNSPCYSDDLELVSRSHRDHLEYLVSNGICRGYAPEVADTMQELLSGGEYMPENLEPEAVQALYGKTLRLSSSKLDTLASCNMQYFLTYGLKAKERKSVSMDASLYGTFVHYVLEHTAREVKALGGFAAVTLAQTMEIASRHMEEYTQNELKDLWKSERAEYLFRRNFMEVEEVVQDLYRELSNSKFTPEWFELHFAKGADLPEIRIVGEKMTAAIEGYVDRADIWEHDGKLYVRIVDYKTGKKSLDYTKIFYGLGLQMLIYLFALEKQGAVLAGRSLTPAGVLYFPARSETVTVKSAGNISEAQRKQLNGKKRSGLLLNSDPVLQAMEPCSQEENPIYLPYKKKKSGEKTGDLASGEELAKLGEFVFRKLSELGDQLYSGDISPNPYDLGGSSPCKWCVYSNICRDRVNVRELQKVKDLKEFWERLEQEDGENG